MSTARLLGNLVNALRLIGLRVQAGRVEPVRQALGSQFEELLALSSLHELRRLVHAFELEFAAAVGARHAIGVDSGTSALYFALRALDIGPGDEVITVPNSWITTITTIRETGATCVLADIERTGGALDVEHAARLITPRTRAIVPVHMYGLPADMRAILSLARRTGIHVVEDACQGAGATFEGRAVGTWGDIGCFSFHANKLVGAPFDGGMLCTESSSLAKRLRGMCEPDWETALDQSQPRVPSRLAALAVPVLRHKLACLEAQVRLRNEQAEQFRAALSGDAGARILSPPRGGRSSYRSCVLTSPRIDDYRKTLRGAGWNLGPMYAQAAEFVRRAESGGALLPQARWLAEHHLILPTGEALTNDDTQAICNALSKAVVTA